MSVQHFLTLNDLTFAQLQQLIVDAKEIKAKIKSGEKHRPLDGKRWG